MKSANFFCFVLYCKQRRCSQIKPQLNVEIEDRREKAYRSIFLFLQSFKVVFYQFLKYRLWGCKKYSQLFLLKVYFACRFVCSALPRVRSKVLSTWSRTQPVVWSTQRKITLGIVTRTGFKTNMRNIIKTQDMSRTRNLKIMEIRIRPIHPTIR